MNFKVKHFNKLSPKEVHKIAKVRTNVFIIEQNINEDDLDDLDFDSYHMYLENDKEEIIAYCRILKPEVVYKEASIGRVIVTKENRRKGIAENMMREAIDFIFSRLEEDKVKISAQEYVAKLYESVGFEKLGDVYDEVGVPHIKMILFKENYK